MGYKTCHAMNTSLDASICAKDCERLETHKFATKCKQKGGFYKCCIRRDAVFCHECRYQDTQISGIMLTSGSRYKYQLSGISLPTKRVMKHMSRFCCTLSMCTFPSGAFESPGNHSSIFDYKVGLLFLCPIFLWSGRPRAERPEEPVNGG